MIRLVATATTDWLTAIGTVGAVVVALLLSVPPALLRWYRRPRLKLLVSEVEPHVRASNDGLDTAVRMELRIEVRNEGFLEAGRVRGQLVDVWTRDDGGQDGKHWTRKNTEPIPLQWVDLRGPRDEIDIPAWTSAFPSVVSYERKPGRLVLCVPSGAESVFFRPEFSTTYAEYRVGVILYAANVGLSRRVVGFKMTKEHWFAEAGKARRPRERDVHREGLMRRFAEARTETSGRRPSPTEPEP
jgi:hypothetical protein